MVLEGYPREGGVGARVMVLVGKGAGVQLVWCIYKMEAWRERVSLDYI